MKTNINNKKALYTHGSIGGTMIKTALSMIPATLAISGYNIADTYFVSRLGTLPLAAMGFTFPMVMLIGCIYRGISTGAMTPLAHSVGSNRSSKAAKVVSSGLLLVIIFSVIFGLAGYFSTAPVFAIFGAEGEVMPMVIAYMGIWYLGNFTIAISMICNNFLIAMGAARVASLMMVGGMLLNVLLDPLFIFGLGPVPAMGIKGAALATVLSQSIVSIVMLLVLHYRYQLFTATIFHWRLLKSAWKVIIRIAVPSTIGALMMPIGNSIIVRIVAGFGDDVVAGCAAAGRLEMVAFIVPMSLGISMIPMIAQNFGAKRFDRINECRRFAMRFAGFFELFMAIVYFVFAPWLAGFFSKDPRVIEVMVIYLRIIPFGFGMMEIHRYSTFVYTGCNKPAASAWLNALRLFGLLVPFSLLALLLNSLNGLFVARLAADLLAGGIGMWFVRRMTMKLSGAKVNKIDAEIIAPDTVT